MTGPRTFMVVDADAKHAQQVADMLANAYPGATIERATDARSALFRMQNVPPQVLICSAGELDNGIQGLQLVESVLQDRALQTAVVITASTPIPETYTQDIISGRLHVVSRPAQSAALLRAMTYAINYKHTQFSGSFRVHSLAAGERLFLEGEKAEQAYFVKSGKLRASRFRSGKVDVLGEILPGEFVGEMSYFNNEGRSADVEAVEGCELIQIPHSILDSLLFTKPAWSMALAKTLAKRLKRANQE